MWTLETKSGKRIEIDQTKLSLNNTELEPSEMIALADVLLILAKTNMKGNSNDLT